MLKRIQSDTILDDGKLTIFDADPLTTAAGVVVDGPWSSRVVQLPPAAVEAIQAAIAAPVAAP